MNSEQYFTLMCYLAQKHNEQQKMPEYEFLLYEGMCRSQAALSLMQEAAFKLETQKLNEQLDGDAGRDAQKAA